jgi:hypothetical protein
MEGHLKGVKGNIMPHRATHLGIFGRCFGRFFDGFDVHDDDEE